MNAIYITNLPAGLISWRRSSQAAYQAITSRYKVIENRPLCVDGAPVMVITFEVDVSKPNSIAAMGATMGEVAEILGVDRIAVYSTRTDEVYGFNLNATDYRVSYPRGEFVMPSGKLLS